MGPPGSLHVLELDYSGETPGSILSRLGPSATTWLSGIVGMDASQESAAPRAPLGYACFPCIVHERTHVQEYRAVFLRSPLLVQAGEPVARLTVGARLEERLARPASYRSVLLALVFKGTLLSVSCCLWREDCFFVVLRGLTEGCGCSLVPSSLAVRGGSEHCFREPHWLTRFFPQQQESYH